MLYKNLGDKAQEALTLIVYKSIFDCIAKEEDFGPGNWGILQGKETCLAPFYDNAETMLQLMMAINDRTFSPEKAIDYALGDFETPFISFREEIFVAKEGFESITNEAIGRFKETYSVERFCFFVKDAIFDVSQYINIGKDVGVFFYTALVLRYLHVIEGLGMDELLEVADSIPHIGS